MNSEQFAQLIALLTRLVDKPYTITGAADWPVLVIVGGLLVGSIALMWADLKSSLKEYKTDNTKAHDCLWQAQRDCKEDCCPGRERKS